MNNNCELWLRLLIAVIARYFIFPVTTGNIMSIMVKVATLSVDVHVILSCQSRYIFIGLIRYEFNRRVHRVLKNMKLVFWQILYPAYSQYRVNSFTFDGPNGGDRKQLVFMSSTMLKWRYDKDKERRSNGAAYADVY